MKKHLFLSLALALFVLSACQKEDVWSKAPGTTNNVQTAKNSRTIGKEHLTIAVLSDIHYMHPSLLLEPGAETGKPFLTDMIPNKALQVYSVPVFEQVVSELIAEHPDILLVAGDLAKDGEAVSHTAVASALQKLQSLYGIKVYVTTGNNDINNNAAVAYTQSARSAVPYVTPEEFATIYGSLGYDNAIKRDASSLSYVAQPYEGLWILAIDAAHYTPFNRQGSIKQETMQWIWQVMQEARANDVTVLALMHHNAVEHMPSQATILENTVIERWKTATDSLIDAGLQVIFTGHNHATDITTRTKDNHTLYDVETGSLITPPTAYRIATLKNKELDIDTRLVTSISAPLPGNASFTAYSQQALSALIDKFFTGAFNNPASKYYLPPTVSGYAVPLTRKAWMAHIAGDEKLAPAELARIDSLAGAAPEANQIVVPIIRSFWTDLNTKDQKWHIKLSNP